MSHAHWLQKEALEAMIETKEVWKESHQGGGEGLGGVWGVKEKNTHKKSVKYDRIPASHPALSIAPGIDVHLAHTGVRLTSGCCISKHLGPHRSSG